jgi:hypothetical protein
VLGSHADQGFLQHARAALKVGNDDRDHGAFNLY